MNIYFAYEFFYTMTLDRYFKQKGSLPNLHGDLSFNISGAIITAMNHEVTSKINTMSGSGQAAGVKKPQPLCKNREQNLDILLASARALKCPTTVSSFLTVTAYLSIELNGFLTQINSSSNVVVHTD